MERRIINPWTWQEQYGFVQGIEVSGAQRILFCAGQTSTDDDGNVVYAGDMQAQLAQSIDNLERVLDEAGYTLADVQRLTTYVTDMDAYFEAAAAVGGRLAGYQLTATVLGVTRLALPGLMVEIEATAVK